MYKKILLAFLIYSYFFCNLGNTCFRINSDNVKVFSIVPLLTEGIYGPLRSALLLLYYNGFSDFLFYVFDSFLHLHNIYGALLFVFYGCAIFELNF
jgi:hypothetical protein